MIATIACSCCGMALIMVGLLVSGVLHPCQTLRRAWDDADYYRMAAQSCAAAVAHREAQLRVVEALLEKQQGAQ